MNSAPPQSSAGSSFLIVRHASRYRGFYDVILDWVALNLPEQRARFDLRVLPCKVPEHGGSSLMIPWLQDPVEQWSMRTYRQAVKLIAECDARGIPVVNRVERLARAGKFEGSLLMRAAGVRTPRVARIPSARAFRSDFAELSFPLFVREDLGHGSEMLRADDVAQARALSLRRFKQPVAIELIDLPHPADRLYRKYRYVVAGEFGVPHHLQASTGWITRGEHRVLNDTTRAEELAYIESPCPHHDAFQRARRALGLDVVAFDYSLDREGNPVVWEANPYPYFRFSRRDLVYRNEAMHRTMAIIVAFYFERAGLPLPVKLAGYLGECKSVLPAKPAGDKKLTSDSWQIPPPPQRPPRTRVEQFTDAVRDTVRRLRGKRLRSLPSQ